MAKQWGHLLGGNHVYRYMEASMGLSELLGREAFKINLDLARKFYR